MGTGLGSSEIAGFWNPSVDLAGFVFFCRPDLEERKLLVLWLTDTTDWPDGSSDSGSLYFFFTGIIFRIQGSILQVVGSAISSQFSNSPVSYRI
ncbi:unnamed protein product [Blepharisma stoltei]|uniref:Uncharacterized protein n=1 Tax=Blepharisma stoltei TaxID=1481888 RepID=A0AAU9K8U7_9CILI|nr:unnamed protein product [Blepharisma stoltei]